MPGITGIVAKRFGEEHKAALQQMVKCMEHEPFYVSGAHIVDQLGVGVGWAVHPGTFSDCLPVWNERRDVGLFFTGEHFGEHQSELSELRSKGHQCEAPNASYLVHLYEEKGLDGFLERINGWFSGMLLDLRDGKVVLFNDRYGLKRIYYHEEPEAFYFASEAKSLLKVLPKSRQLDATSLGEFFSCGCALQNRSLFAGVSLLPGGSKWLFAHGQAVKKASYFRPGTWEQQPALKGGEYYEKLKDTFARILPRYFSGDQRVGVSLTGGVDSRLIMAWTKRGAGALPCYTFGGIYRDCVDVTVARQVAKLCGQPHQVIPVGREFLSQFPKLAEETVYLTDGAMDVSASPDLFVNRLARGIAPVRMTGNYGGEILRSLVAFKPMPVDPAAFEPGFRIHIRQAAQTYAQELNPRRLSFVAWKQVPWHHYARLALEQSQLTLRSPYLDNDLVSLVFQAPPELAASNELSLRLIGDGDPELSRIGTDRGILHRSLPVITRLKHLCQEFTFKAEYAYDYGMPHWLAKIDRTFAPLHFEKLFLGRHKFYHFRIWYRDALAGYLKEVLLDSRTLGRPYLVAARVERMVKNHTSGRENHTYALHRILASELIQRRLIEQR
jgi:asparagine synthase (glutamine-hydrolysing)